MQDGACDAGLKGTDFRRRSPEFRAFVEFLNEFPGRAGGGGGCGGAAEAALSLHRD